MRIISIVTLISPDGAYGGPTRVALNQAAEMRRRGHEVVIAAGYRGFREPPTTIDGVPVKLFPARTAIPAIGFAGLAAPGLLQWLSRVAPLADVVHVHTARDLITLPAAWTARQSGTPYVLQTHGMIDPSPRRSAHVLDRLLTRPLLRDAGEVFYLTERERQDLLEVFGGELRTRQLMNGVPEAPAATSFAATPAGTPAAAPREVLYLARLQRRKRPQLFVQAAQELQPRFPDVTFSLVGPDEGEGEETSRLIEQGGAARWEGPIPPEESLARLARAAVYVLPAVDEPFPMSVLEAMSLGLPVVITDSCGLAPLVQASGCGLVCDAGLSSLVDAIASLLEDASLARAMGERGLAYSRDSLSMAAVGESLEESYSRL